MGLSFNLSSVVQRTLIFVGFIKKTLENVKRTEI
jgi:hypothetical protein